MWKWFVSVDLCMYTSINRAYCIFSKNFPMEVFFCTCWHAVTQAQATLTVGRNCAAPWLDTWTSATGEKLGGRKCRQCTIHGLYHRQPDLIFLLHLSQRLSYGLLQPASAAMNHNPTQLL